ncbi:MAG: DNA internalization-related competence protein ComEC/Rec2 [Caldithrix sp.]|nr:DNA internalization-related competence protein ComEC/Rec2 [Caldithrix sp.]
MWEKINTSLTNFIRYYPAGLLTLFFVLGVVSGWTFKGLFPIQLSFWVFIGLVCITLYVHGRMPSFFIPLLILLIFLAGVLRIHFSLFTFEPDHILKYKLYKIDAFEGWVQEAQYKKDGKHRYIIQCDQIVQDTAAQIANGKIIVYQGKSSLELAYGDRVRIDGRPFEPSLPSNPGDFNYRRYLHLKGIYYQYYLGENDVTLLERGTAGHIWKKNIVMPIRRYIEQTIAKYFVSPTSDVIRALILGQRQDLDEHIVDTFKRTGIVHVLAISGLHVGFIILIFMMLFSFLRVSYTWRILLTLGCLFIFVAIVNFKPPVVRASLMAALYFTGQIFQRKTSPLNIIAAAGLILLIIEPQQLFQPGFQFSFAAVFSIIYGYPKIDKLFPSLPHRLTLARGLNAWVRQPFLVSAAAVLGTLPLTWYYYGVLQIGALLVNIFIIPLIGGFVILTLLFLLVSLSGFFAINGLALLLHLYYAAILHIIHYFSKIPFVQIALPPPQLGEFLLIILIILLFFNAHLRIDRIWLSGSLILLFVLTTAPSRNDHNVQLIQAKVGQGDGALIKFPNQKVMVIDGGDLKFHWNAGERYMVPLLKHLGITHIDYLVGSHAHSDHIGGLPTLLKQFKVDTLVLPPFPAQSNLYNNLLKTANERDVAVIFKERGDQLDVGPQNRCYILHPFGRFGRPGHASGETINNSSLVMKILHGQTSFLFTGDLESTAEPALLSYDNFLNCDVLKVGHHGSITSTSDEFLHLIKPEYATVSVGRNNKFYHPSRKTMRRLVKNFAHPLRTDRYGGLWFKSDGNKVHLYNWR